MKNLTKMTLANRSREGGNQGGGNRGGGGGRGGNRGGGARNAYEGAYNTYNAYNGGSEGETMEMNNRGNRGGSMEMGYAYEGGMNNAYNEGGSMEMNGGQYRMGSDKGWVVKPIEDRMEGNRSRMGYEPSNGYETRMGGMETEVESRFRDRRGREHYNNGRFAPMRSAYEGEMEGRMPPIYNPGNEYRNDGSNGRMIGFYGGMGGQDELSSYRNKHQMGHASSEMEPFDRKKAHEWVKKMKNSDGSTGEHWTFEQTSQVMKQRGIDCDPAEFYATMNMLWSDYGAVAKKFGVDSVEYWSELAKSFLMDKDAEKDKLALYYECIVKK